MRLFKNFHFLIILLIGLILFSCTDKHTEEPEPQNPPKQIISVERAKELYDSYSSRRVPIIQKFEGKNTDSSDYNPTRYIEYDFETMKNYLAYVEQEAAKANIDVKSLRIYLANNPDSDKFPNGDPIRYKKHNTVLMVPTMSYEGKNVGFALEEDNRGNLTGVPISKMVDSLNIKGQKGVLQQKSDMNAAGFFISNSSTVAGGTVSVILNDGDLIPPPKQQDDFGN